MKIVPIIFGPDGEPRDAELLDAVQAWLSAESGTEMKLKPIEKAWAVVECDGESLKVRGVGILRSVIDTMLHVDSEMAGVKLYGRMHNYLEDQGVGGNEVLVHIDPKALPMWTGFLESKGIKPADRWRVRIGE